MKSELQDTAIFTGKLNGIYRGVVEDNLDTLNAGRVRVRIYGIHSDSKTQTSTDGIPTAHLPWAEPAFPPQGGSERTGIYGVPNVGANVFLFFENGDLTQPRYFAVALGIPYESQPGSASKVAFEPDYSTGDQMTDPTKVVGLFGHAGHQVILDSTEQNENILIKHGRRNSSIGIDYEGTINLHSMKDINEDCTDKNTTIKGNHSLAVTNDFLVKAKNANENITGNKDIMVTGAHSETIMSTMQVSTKKSVFGSSDETIISAGGKNTLAAGDECLVKSTDKDVIVYAEKMGIKLKALLGKIESTSLQLDLKATITADFCGLMTTCGGATSMITSVTGTIIMIG